MLVGPADLDGRTAPTGSSSRIIVASEVIGMHDDPAQGVRRKKDSTLVRAAEAVRDGNAGAMISAGNTGATMASALLRMGRISGVKRPAIATPIPVPGTTPTILLDSGANAEVQAEWLVQFALMGSVYARERFEIEHPASACSRSARRRPRATRSARRPSSCWARRPGSTSSATSRVATS